MSRRGPKPGLVAKFRGTVGAYDAVLVLAAEVVARGGSWKRPKRLKVDPALLPRGRKAPYVNREGQLCDRNGVLLQAGLYYVPLLGRDRRPVLDRQGRRC